MAEILSPYQQVLWLDVVADAVDGAQALNASYVGQGAKVACTLVRKGLTLVNQQSLAISSGYSLIGLFSGTTLLCIIDGAGPVAVGQLAFAFTDMAT